MSERWQETYDQWKLATPPEHEGDDEECDDCGADEHDGPCEQQP
jgi:hypothetical protein